jgi:hypothetical protein
LGIIGSLIVGDYSNAVARILHIIPLSYLGIGYLLELISIVCDICIVLFKPVELVFGIKRPFLFRSSLIDMFIYPGLTMDKDGHSPRIMPIYFETNMEEYVRKFKSAQEAPIIEQQKQEFQRQQQGGGSATGKEKTALDYLAMMMILAVVGGGLLLSAGRSSNGLFPDKNDPPPNPRDV